MPFEPGKPRAPTAGRRVGSVNKSVVRELIEEKLGKSIPERIMELAAQHGRTELKVLIELMPYAYSKLQAIEINNIGEDISDMKDQVKQVSEWINSVKQVKENLECGAQITEPTQNSIQANGVTPSSGR